MQFAVYRKKQITEHEKLTKKEGDNLAEIYLEISISAGKYAPLIKECTGLETIQTSAGPEDIWNWAFNFEENTLVLSALNNCLQATARTIGKLADDIKKGIRDEQGILIEKPPKAPEGKEKPSIGFKTPHKEKNA